MEKGVKQTLVKQRLVVHRDKLIQQIPQVQYLGIEPAVRSQ
jgi:hypothetical protein